MINIKECAKYLIDREDCSYKGYDRENRAEHYQNNEIDILGYNWNGIKSNESACFDVCLLDEISLNDSNYVRIITNSEIDVPYTRFVFCLANGKYIRIEIEADRKIEFHTLVGKWIEVCRRKNGEFLWFENHPDLNEKFYLESYGAENLADKIYSAITREENNPEFERLFEIIKPIIVLSIIEINVKRAKLLYSWIQDYKRELQEIDHKLRNSQEYDQYELYKARKEKARILVELDEYEAEIDGVQYSVMEDCAAFDNDNKQKA